VAEVLGTTGTAGGGRPVDVTITDVVAGDPLNNTE